MKLICTALVLLLSTSLYSQNWFPAFGIHGQRVLDLEVYNGDTLLAGTLNNGVLVSYDNGLGWDTTTFNSQKINTILVVGKQIFAGTDQGIYSTNQLGQAWSFNGLGNQEINKLSKPTATAPQEIFALTTGVMGPGALHRSLDLGQNWSTYVSTPPYAFLDMTINPINNRLLIATPFGAHYSDNRTTWTATTPVLGTVRKVQIWNGDTILYNDDFGFYYSTNNGVNASQINTYPAVHFVIGNRIYFDDLKYVDQLFATPIASNFNGSARDLIENNGRLIAAKVSGGIDIKGGLPVGLSIQIVDESMLIVYPNPVKDNLHLKLNKATLNATFSIFDQNGRMVKHFDQLSGSWFRLELDLSSGTYLCSFESEIYSEQFKIIKD